MSLSVATDPRGETVKDQPVHVAGDDRDEVGIATGGLSLRADQPAGLGRPRCGPGVLRLGSTGGIAQPGQRDV
jgi:hypothetical protein